MTTSFLQNEKLLKATEIQELFESYYNLITIPVAVAKPVTPGDLLLKIREVLDK